jgi:hypothetical protein
VVERCFSKLESEIGDIISHPKEPCVQGTSLRIDPMIEELRKVHFGQYKVKDIEWEIVHPYMVDELR